MSFDVDGDGLLDLNEFSGYARAQYPNWKTYNSNYKHVEYYISVSLYLIFK